jgi:ubiquinone/menaquinone biosynthesis C-methylase UbiE
MNKLEQFWNSCDENFAHIKLERHHSGYKNLINSWEKNFISYLQFSGGTIVDYGIGAGYLAKYFFEKKMCSKYIGIDISTRSLNAARLNLINFEKSIELINSDQFYSSFNEPADLFVSQACIQHFPTEKYLINFLEKLNKLVFSEIMLQIRYSNSTSFNPNYENEDQVCFACKTNFEFISKYLNNYQISRIGEISPKSKYQYLIFKNKIN